MKYRTVTERIGEYLGPVDWSYDFSQHFRCCNYRSDEAREADIKRSVDWLRQIVNAPDKYEATTDGGCPKFGWQRICSVGMYDGWPYWKPTPSVCLCGTLGPEWHSFDSLTGVMELRQKVGAS